MKTLYVILVAILDYVFLSQVFTYNDDIENMPIIVLITYLIISFIVWVTYKLSKNKVVWAFVVHNIVFTLSAFSLLLHAFAFNMGTLTKIMGMMIFLFQSVAFYLYYTKYLPKDYFKE